MERVQEAFHMLLPWINSGLFVTLIIVLFNWKKNNAETNKLNTESSEINHNTEIKLISFYQSQVRSLTEKYEELKAKFDKKEEEHNNCEERICELEEKYDILINQINNLKK